jgi:hypothetical protein
MGGPFLTDDFSASRTQPGPGEHWQGSNQKMETPLGLANLSGVSGLEW